MGIYTESYQHPVDNFDNGPVGVMGIVAPFQNTGVSRFQTKGKYIETDIRPRFVNNTHDPERYRYFGNLHPIGTYGLTQHLSQRGGQLRHLTHIGGNGLYPLPGQFQPVVFRVGRFHEGQVFGILGQYIGGGFFHFVGHGTKKAVYGFLVYQIQFARGGLYRPESIIQAIHSSSFRLYKSTFFFSITLCIGYEFQSK